MSSITNKNIFVEPYYLLGEGSNSVFLEDFEGRVIRNKVMGFEVKESGKSIKLRVGAGENWHSFIHTCLKNKWYGMENLALIPGSVGASPIQNIGAYGLEVNTFIDSVEFVCLVTGKHQQLTNHECGFGYRDSIFKRNLMGKVLITHVNFDLPKSNNLETSYGELAQLEKPTPQKIFDKVVAIRLKKLPDPNKLGNAGSFFKNPVVELTTFEEIRLRYPSVPHFMVEDNFVKIPAAWLIDTLGFKGKIIGGVQSHPKQPLVLVNLGNATGQDLVTFAKLIINKVYEEFSINLEPEVRLIGKNGLIEL